MIKIKQLVQNEYFICLVIFSLNLIFKLILIGNSSFWYDEIISVKDTQLNFGHIKHESEWDSNPPFYYYLLWIWSKLFGITEIGIRSFSAFFTSLGAIFIYKVSVNLFSRTSALITTLIYSLHPLLYFYSQEGRCYGLLVFLILLNLYLLLRYSKKASILHSVLIGITNFLIVYTHYIAGSYILVQFLFIIFLKRKNWFNISCFYLVPLALVLLRFTKNQFVFLFSFHKLSIGKSTLELANWEEITKATNALWISTMPLAIYFCVLIYFMFKRFYVNKNKNISWDELFILISPICIIIFVFVVGKFTYVFNQRYLVFSIPLIILSYGMALNKLSKSIKFFIVLVIVVVEISMIKPGQSRKMDFKFASQVTKVIQNSKNKSTVFIQNKDVFYLFMYYYDRDNFIKNANKPFSDLDSLGIYPINSSEDFIQKNAESQKSVLILQAFISEKESESTKRILKERKYRFYESKSIEGINLIYGQK